MCIDSAETASVNLKTNDSNTARLIEIMYTFQKENQVLRQENLQLKSKLENSNPELELLRLQKEKLET